MSRVFEQALYVGFAVTVSLLVASGSARSDNKPFGFDTPKPPVPKVQETIYDVLAVGPTSPNGVSSEGLDASQMFENMDAAQNASPPQGEEAAYWMRRLVIQALAEQHTVYAMSQLAASYGVDISDKENVRRMELIWQLLAVAGNSTAMCNIGLMYKDGIGVPKDSRLARQWYERAQAAGCKDASKALADLGQ